MNIVRNILAVVVGIIGGGIVNLGLVSVGYSVFPLPEGADVSSMQRLAETIHLFNWTNFIFPFLGHAAGPLVGTFIAMLLAASHKGKIAIGMGIWFLLGGIVANFLIPAPLWYKAVDPIFAYVPMTWIGAKLGGVDRSTNA
jgi:hypothetical protein